ncbi:penicillin-binding protein 1A [Fodinicurvata sp. EGI_FJ10296]|uniref:penicillin-binding protein 1A n=1 Tax=Fodinicurvata sp. EGI_FJ10296 TaxID=3231908 RepID=UPI0034556B85
MRILGWFISSLLIVTVVGGAAAYGALSHFSLRLPDYRQLADYEPPVTTRFHASDGRLLDEFAIENRLFVPINVIPERVRQAFIAAEDQNFYGHSGIDPTSLVRAVVTNIRNIGSGQRPEGASTITQQVAKNFLLTSDVTLDRKIREALIALRMERTFSKDQILELYLNQIYLGRGAYGVAAASLAYFNRSLSELNLEEIAYLAALPKAPNNYHPTRRTEAAVSRRNYVLNRMLDDGYITEDEHAEAVAAPLEVTNQLRQDVVRADYFSEEVRRIVQRIYGDTTLYEGGLSVRTTVDPFYQRVAGQALRNGLVDYDRRFGWRGPIANMADFDAWPEQLRDIRANDEDAAGIEDWRLAVVLEIDADGALIGFEDRSRGWMDLESVSWARPHRGDGRSPGPAPQSVEDVLALGDVVAADASVNRPDYRAAPRDEEASEAVAEGDLIPRFALRQIPEIEGAVVVMDPHTGRVMATTGGYSFERSEFNRATQAERQPGSAFKPFVYLAGLEAGLTPSTILYDTPVAISQGAGQGLWRPTNYGGDSLGAAPMRVGLERSRNLMTVRLLQEVGLERVREVASEFGIYEEMPLLYSMALGAGETTPLDLTAAYAMLVNGGLRIEPTFIDRIQDRTGRTIYRHDERGCNDCTNVAWNGQETPALPDDRERVADPVSAYQVVSMMEGVIQRGTGQRLQSIGKPLAGKTGTTNDVRDAWFIGSTPDLVVGVFVGYDAPHSLGEGQTGSSVALPIFGEFMETVLDGQQVPPFRIPQAANLIRVNPRTGQQASSGEPFIWEAFQAGSGPSTAGTIGGVSDFTAPGDDNDGGFTGGGTGGLY